MKYINVGHNKVVKVDDADYALVVRHRWCVNCGKRNKTFYAVRGTRKGGFYRRHYMHRDILGVASGVVVDHINHDGLDNRRCNLRVVSQGQNLLIRHANDGRRYKGVSFYGDKWSAHFCGKHIGYFNTEEDAARAYNTVAYRDGGDLVLLNKIEGMSKEYSISMPVNRAVRLRRSKYRGVRHRGEHCWEAYIYYDGKARVIGYYRTEDEAGKAYYMRCKELGCLERVNNANWSQYTRKPVKRVESVEACFYR